MVLTANAPIATTAAIVADTTLRIIRTGCRFRVRWKLVQLHDLSITILLLYLVVDYSMFKYASFII